MYTKGRKKDTVRFKLIPNNRADKVCLAGDFTNWQTIRMRKQKDGGYAVTVDLPAGTYQYKFQVDDEWLLDPDHQVSALNSYGTLNSLAKISEEQ